MNKITDKVMRATHVGYKSRLEDKWSDVLQYLEDLGILPPAAVKQFFSPIF